MLGIASGLAMPLPALAEAALTYAGPNVVLVRFGGGVRRDDRRRGHLIPYPRHSLAPRDTFIPDLCID